MKDTQELRSDVLQIRQDLRDGKISNQVARTLLFGAKTAVDTLKLEMDAAKLGCDFRPVAMNQEDRPSIRRVA
jgi:hypothetical protein